MIKMSDYAVIYTTGKRRHVVTHRIVDVPAEMRAADVRARLAESEWAPGLSTYGELFANRRVTSTLPADAVEVPGGARVIEWPALIDTRRTAQLNVRVRPAERARWTEAANVAGMSLAAWIVAALNERAGVVESGEEVTA